MRQKSLKRRKEMEEKTEKLTKGRKKTMKISTPDFSQFVSCLEKGKEEEEERILHLGVLFKEGLTVCDRKIGYIVMTKHIEINCPDCIAELKYRRDHPEVRGKKIGIMTHKGEV